ncbi:hypothetical protein [Aliikangiella coralliicola]|uniref:Secreted protein n=1 Tax=Aliikangiella coralliicola TaxID=2592383 RepID=A0A545UIX7_9GAMM|nr:hypothetical protein [Aliikangiella coralliicola]TQV89417.1 hypothetical protein FLL46_00610 [Aliikangiella coralliicola]
MKKLLRCGLIALVASVFSFSGTVTAGDNCTWQLVEIYDFVGFKGAEYRSVGECQYVGKFVNYRNNTVHYW